jgi:hypothetical protein
MRSVVNIANIPRTMPGLLALYGLALGVTCTNANESLVVVQAQIPEDKCVIADELSGAGRLANGVLDVGLDQSYPYWLFPLLVNNLPSLASESDLEPNRITVTGAKIKILPPPGVKIPWTDQCAAEFDDPSQATLQPGQQRVIKIEALRSCHAQLFRDLFAAGSLDSSIGASVTFRAVMRAKGRHGGTEILSDPFEFPIRVCYGCLQTGFTGAYAAFNFPEVPACDRLVENPFPGNLCNKSQDFGPILCCAKDPQGTMLQCPAAPAASPTTTNP